MENKLKCRVVMLPTHSKSNIRVSGQSRKLEYKEKSAVYLPKCYHLYLTSNREIKAGDWIYEISSQKIGIYDHDQNNNTHDLVIGDVSYPFITSEYFRKIEATTNPDLWTKEHIEGTSGHFLNKPIPKIPESFIQEYVEKQGKIDEVLIEVERSGWIGDAKTLKEAFGVQEIQTKIRTDDTVIIHRFKGSYTHEELKHACNQAYWQGAYVGPIASETEFELWFDQKY